MYQWDKILSLIIYLVRYHFTFCIKQAPFFNYWLTQSRQKGLCAALSTLLLFSVHKQSRQQKRWMIMNSTHEQVLVFSISIIWFVSLFFVVLSASSNVFDKLFHPCFAPNKVAFQQHFYRWTNCGITGNQFENLSN